MEIPTGWKRHQSSLQGGQVCVLLWETPPQNSLPNLLPCLPQNADPDVPRRTPRGLTFLEAVIFRGPLSYWRPWEGVRWIHCFMFGGTDLKCGLKYELVADTGKWKRGSLVRAARGVIIIHFTLWLQTLGCKWGKFRTHQDRMTGGSSQDGAEKPGASEPLDPRASVPEHSFPVRTLRARSPGFIYEDDWGRQTAREDGLRNYLSQAGESLCRRSASTSPARAQGARSRFHLSHRRQPEAQPAGPLDSKHPNQAPASCSRLPDTVTVPHVAVPALRLVPNAPYSPPRGPPAQWPASGVAFAGHSHRLDSGHLRLVSAGPSPLTSARSWPTLSPSFLIQKMKVILLPRPHRKDPWEAQTKSFRGQPTVRNCDPEYRRKIS